MRSRQMPGIWPPQQKTPRRGGGALLGLLQGGEICISIYVDPWEVGEPVVSWAPDVGSNWGHMYDAGLSQKVFVYCSFIGSSYSNP